MVHLKAEKVPTVNIFLPTMRYSYLLANYGGEFSCLVVDGLTPLDSLIKALSLNID